MLAGVISSRSAGPHVDALSGLRGVVSSRGGAGGSVIPEPMPIPGSRSSRRSASLGLEVVGEEHGAVRQGPLP